MAEIVEIAGLERGVRRSAPQSRSVSGIQDEIKQRAALVKKRPPVDTANLSEGEMLVQLVQQRMQMLADFYPDYPQYRSAATMGDNALFQGLHTGTGVGAWTKVLDPIQQEMAWAIIEGKRLTDPASGWLPWEYKARTPNDGGFSISGIPLLNCDQFNSISQSQWAAQNPAAPASMYQVYVQNNANLKQACVKENEWRTLLNEKYEKTGHHALYNFVLPNDPTVTEKVNEKQHDHESAILAISGLSKISFNNLKQWQINGVLSQNIANNVGALSPTETIDYFRIGSEENVGVIELATIIAITKLVLAIAGAITAAGGFVLALKGKDQSAAATFESLAKGWGEQYGNIKSNDGVGFGPNYSDWRVGANTGGGNTENQGGGNSNNDSGGGGLSLGKNGLLIGGGLLLGAALLMGGGKK